MEEAPSDSLGFMALLDDDADLSTLSWNDGTAWGGLDETLVAEGTDMRSPAVMMLLDAH